MWKALQVPRLKIDNITESHSTRLIFPDNLLQIGRGRLPTGSSVRHHPPLLVLNGRALPRSSPRASEPAIVLLQIPVRIERRSHRRHGQDPAGQLPVGNVKASQSRRRRAEAESASDLLLQILRQHLSDVVTEDRHIANK